MHEGQTGAINPGLLFCTLPTARLTFHAFISSAGNGLSVEDLLEVVK